MDDQSILEWIKQGLEGVVACSKPSSYIFDGRASAGATNDSYDGAMGVPKQKAYCN